MKTLLEVLIELRGHVEQAVRDNNYYPDTFDPYGGICRFINNHKNMDNELCADFGELIMKWPLAVNDVFVVPKNRRNTRPLSAKYAFMTSTPEQMWFVGEYAELRMELLNWMIKELQNDYA